MSNWALFTVIWTIVYRGFFSQLVFSKKACFGPIDNTFRSSAGRCQLTLDGKPYPPFKSTIKDSKEAKKRQIYSEALKVVLRDQLYRFEVPIIGMKNIGNNSNEVISICQAFISLDIFNVILSLERNRTINELPVSVLKAFTELYKAMKKSANLLTKVKTKYQDSQKFNEKLLVKPMEALMDALDLRQDFSQKAEVIMHHFINHLSQEMKRFGFFDIQNLISKNLTIEDEDISPFLIDINISKNDKHLGLSQLFANQNCSEKTLFRHYLIIRVFKDIPENNFKFSQTIDITDDISYGFRVCVGLKHVDNCVKSVCYRYHKNQWSLLYDVYTFDGSQDLIDEVVANGYIFIYEKQ